MAVYDWILGLMFILGLSIFMTYFTKKNLASLMIWFTVFSAFMVWVQVFELWILILTLILTIVIVYFDWRSDKNG